VADLVAAARYLQTEHEAPRLLVGHSLGGAAVLAAAAELPGVRAVATIGAPFEANDVRRLLVSDVETLEREGEASVSIAGRSFRLKREFLEDLREAKSAEAIAGLGRPLMIFHSPVDAVVPVENARRIFATARHPKSLVSLDEVDHMLSDPADASYVAGVLAAWASRSAPPCARRL
jgi:putative redox protein